MKTGFKDPIAVKKDDSSSKEPSKYSAAKNPNYDERSSCFVNQGCHYGSAHAQPIGTEKHSTADVVPMGRVKTMRVDESG